MYLLSWGSLSPRERERNYLLIDMWYFAERGEKYFRDVFLPIHEYLSFVYVFGFLHVCICSIWISWRQRVGEWYIIYVGVLFVTVSEMAGFEMMIGGGQHGCI